MTRSEWAARPWGERIARAGGVARASLARHGFLAGTWTGFFNECDDGNCRECPPKLYETIEAACADARRRPSWGWSAVEIRSATVIPKGEGGQPDYVIGPIVWNGAEGP